MPVQLWDANMSEPVEASPEPKDEELMKEAHTSQLAGTSAAALDLSDQTIWPNKLSDDGLGFIAPSSLTGAFGPITEVVNRLVQSQRITHQQLGDVCRSQEATSSKIRDISSQHEAFEVSQEQALGDVRQQCNHLEQVFRSLLDEKVGDADQRHKVAIGGLEETLHTKLKGHERIVEDARAQFLRWQEDARTETEKIVSQFNDFREQIQSRAGKQSDEHIADCLKLSKRVDVVEQRLASDVKLRGQGVDHAVRELFESSIAESDGQWRQAVRALEVALATRMTALERSFQDVAYKQSEIVSIVLPQWQTSIGIDVCALQTDMEGYQRSLNSEILALEARIVEDRAAHEVALGDSYREIEQRLGSERETLASRLTDVDANYHKLTTALDATEARLAASFCESRPQLDAYKDTLAKESDIPFPDELCRRVASLEDTLRSLFSDKAKSGGSNVRDILELRSEVISCQDKCRKLEESIWVNERHIDGISVKLDGITTMVGDKDFTRELGSVRVELEQRLASSLSSLCGRLDSVEGRDAANCKNLATTQTRFESEVQDIRERLSQGRYHALSIVEAAQGLTRAELQEVRAQVEEQNRKLSTKLIVADVQPLTQSVQKLERKLEGQDDQLDSFALALANIAKASELRAQQAGTFDAGNFSIESEQDERTQGRQTDPNMGWSMADVSTAATVSSPVGAAHHFARSSPVRSPDRWAPSTRASSLTRKSASTGRMTANARFTH